MLVMVLALPHDRAGSVRSESTPESEGHGVARSRGILEQRTRGEQLPRQAEQICSRQWRGEQITLSFLSAPDRGSPVPNAFPSVPDHGNALA